ncbi:MAG: O-antigen ligase family protein, partial [Candidatus Saccharimonadales bacterium]
VLFGSYSRAAWIGAVLSVVVIGAVLVNKTWLLKHQKLLIAASVFIAVVVIGGFVALSSNHRFENIFYHTQSNSSVSTSSNQAHLSALKNGLKQVARQPFGQGPGSSGPASVYNHFRPSRIPENYFLAVGEESGWLGMALFIAINAGVGWMLWLRRRSPFALTLFASLIGITFVNLLSLGWSDDTLCYIWWGLAGLCIALPPESISKDKAAVSKALKA